MILRLISLYFGRFWLGMLILQFALMLLSLVSGKNMVLLQRVSILLHSVSRYVETFLWTAYYIIFLWFNLYLLVFKYFQHGQKSYPLRPELIESTYWLFKATRDPRSVQNCFQLLPFFYFHFFSIECMFGLWIMSMAVPHFFSLMLRGVCTSYMDKKMPRMDTSFLKMQLYDFLIIWTLSFLFLCRYLDAGRDMVSSLQYGARCSCGYCHISDVETHRQEDHMESFFLAETVRTL